MTERTRDELVAQMNAIVDQLKEGGCSAVFVVADYGGGGLSGGPEDNDVHFSTRLSLLGTPAEAGVIGVAMGAEIEREWADAVSKGQITQPEIMPTV